MIKKRVLFALFLLMVAIGYYQINSMLNTPVNLEGKSSVVIVESGATLKSISRELMRQGYFDNAWVVEFSGRWLYQGVSLKAGEYQLLEGMKIEQVLSLLSSGKSILYHIRFIEGWRFKDLRAVLENADQLTSTLKDLSDEALMRKLNAEFLHPEGLFFPDTYSYQRGDTDFSVLKRAFLKMQYELRSVWDARAEDCVVKTPYEALVLASIIEKETGAPEERAAISGVFSRRLKLGMRLQTDPSVIYGLGERYDGNLTKAHLRQDTPYNTYLNYGLPPTPIALPGREALLAAVQPARSNNIYFVARGDGTHVFSDTLDAHNKAVRKFQLNRSSSYRSTK
ncbi:MAG: endolytic transglycosylase MltG [Hahellaceae bacterium]|nr:endolytic transglycosylase MltG [Hahellaceae bacterium]